MQEKPKEKEQADAEQPEKPDSWSEDQKKREYYYDDAHGYNTFDPEDEDEELDD